MKVLKHVGLLIGSLIAAFLMWFVVILIFGGITLARGRQRGFRASFTAPRMVRCPFGPPRRTRDSPSW